eukprot:TRINITY_DN4603_c0_g1_i1.p1 TRINITY_DN4603_c0_g1~~TRINITY_DN4603_c0_g1_i1.p1  ORF type:complete len:103 (+),score=36.40 TRINITY_DN4603_c0_g1_i1:137-445(+)
MAVPCPLLITSDQIGALYDAILVDNEHEDGTLTPQGSALIQTIVYALWQESAEEIVTTKSDFTTKEDVICLLYTSDAADEEDSVDLGGRRIIKKKKNNIDVD